MSSSSHSAEYMRAWRAAHPEQWRAAQKRYQVKNRDKFCGYSRRWREAHPQGNTTACLAWRRANTGKWNALQAKYRIAQMQRTPAWADLKKIEQVYVEARAAAMHVDHVIPLRGKKVSGLHVHTNLQLLCGAENARKRNKFEVQ